jgi:hypothetical protein
MSGPPTNSSTAFVLFYRRTDLNLKTKKDFINFRREPSEDYTHLFVKGKKKDQEDANMDDGKGDPEKKNRKNNGVDLEVEHENHD